MPFAATRVASTQSKHIHTAHNAFDKTVRTAYAHKIAGNAFGEFGAHNSNISYILCFGCLPKVRLLQCLRFAWGFARRKLSIRRSSYILPCTMGKSAWSSRVFASRQRFSQPSVLSIAISACAWVKPISLHWSNCIIISAPRFSSIAITFSGVNRCFDPSICELKYTLSSLILFSFVRENT